MAIERRTIRSFWKPDGRRISQKNHLRLLGWMEAQALSTQPGAVTVFLHSAVHKSARQHAARELGLLKGKQSAGE